jgi:hypothetical protein
MGVPGGFMKREQRRRTVSTEGLLHGGITQYRRGCRCEACGAAWSAYQKTQRARLRRGDGDFRVSAEICREHLQWLSSQHVGLPSVEAACGVDKITLWKIKSGRQKRVRMSTERKIMRVTEDCRADGSWVSAEATRSRIDELRAAGYTLNEIGHMLGNCGHQGVQFYHGKRVQARTELRVLKLYNRLMQGKTVGVDRMMELVEKVA